MLASLSDVKIYLGIADLNSDSLLSPLLEAASAWFCTEVGRAILTASYTETLSGDGSTRAVLTRDWPVTAVASVTIDGAVIPEATTADVDGWVLDGEIVRLRGYQFTEGVKNVEITYTAGYATTPADVRQAVVEMTALKFRERLHVGTSSQTIAGQSATYLPAFVPRSVQDVIDAYRKVIV